MLLSSGACALNWSAGFISYVAIRRVWAMDGGRRDAASLAVLGSQALALASWRLSGGLGSATALMCVLMFALGLVAASRMTVVGVTGGIACGKSTFCRHLAKVHGAEVIDFDKLSREVVEPTGSAYAAVRRAFPRCFVEAQGSPPVLDRAALAEVVFRDAAARRKLNSLIHPAMARRLLALLAWHRLVRWHRFVVVDAPILFESGIALRLLCSPVAVVACSEERQVRRVGERDGMGVDQALRRVRAQWSTARKARMADVVVDADHDDAGELEARMGRAACRLDAALGWL